MPNTKQTQKEKYHEVEVMSKFKIDNLLRMGIYIEIKELKEE